MRNTGTREPATYAELEKQTIKDRAFIQDLKRELDAANKEAANAVRWSEHQDKRLAEANEEIARLLKLVEGLEAKVPQLEKRVLTLTQRCKALLRAGRKIRTALEAYKTLYRRNEDRLKSMFKSGWRDSHGFTWLAIEENYAPDIRFGTIFHPDLPSYEDLTTDRH